MTTDTAINSLDKFLSRLDGVVESPSEPNLYYAICPRCKQNKLGVRKDTGFYWCWRKKCGYKGYVNPEDCVESSYIDINWDVLGDVDSVEVKVEVLPPLSLEDRSCMTLIYHHDYLRGRGFDTWDAAYYPLALHKKWSGFVFFLLQQHGRFVGYIGRNTRESKYRYFNMPGLKFNQLLYGDHLITSNTVVLTEGIISAINVNRHLLSLGIYDITAVATCGSKVSLPQASLLRKCGIDNIYYWHEMDDMDGRVRYEKTGDRLAKEFNVFREEFYTKDPGDLSQSEVSHLIDHPVEWYGYSQITSPV